MVPNCTRVLEVHLVWKGKYPGFRTGAHKPVKGAHPWLAVHVWPDEAQPHTSGKRPSVFATPARKRRRTNFAYGIGNGILVDAQVGALCRCRISGAQPDLQQKSWRKKSEYMLGLGETKREAVLGLLSLYTSSPQALLERVNPLTVSALWLLRDKALLPVATQVAVRYRAVVATAIDLVCTERDTLWLIELKKAQGARLDHTSASLIRTLGIPNTLFMRHQVQAALAEVLFRETFRANSPALRVRSAVLCVSTEGRSWSAVSPQLVERVKAVVTRRK